MRYSKKISSEKNGLRSSRLNKPQPILITSLLLIAFTCLLPMILVVIVSFSTDASIVEKGFSFFPNGWSTDGYKYVWGFRDQIFRAYGVTFFETFVGTALSLLITALFGYALSRSQFMLNKYITYVLIASMLINGGQVSSYIVNTNLYGLKDNLLVLILPNAVNVFNVIVMRTFVRSNVPDALIEAAKIDGAGEWRTFFQIVFPLLKPVLGSLGFMGAVTRWNEWQTSMLYIENSKLSSLQLVLQRVEQNISYLKSNMGSLTLEELEELKNLPEEPARMALMLCSAGPILFIYPFFQRYFIKGMTVGSVKG